MKETWNYDLTDLLIKAKSGNASALQAYLTKFPAFTVANSDATLLLTLRQFDVECKGDKKRIFNFYPAGGDFQWGISITQSTDYGGSETNISLPNSFNYTGLTIEANEINIFVDHQPKAKTNSRELLKKLRFTEEVTEVELVEAFNQLCNEDYPEEKFRKRKIKTVNPFITVAAIGVLPYNPDYGCYEGGYTNESESFDVRVYNGSAKKLAAAVELINEQLPSRFYTRVLSSIDNKIVAKKNPDLYRGLGVFATMEDFRDKLSLQCIEFFNDLSFALCYDDNKMFGGCTIAFYISKTGRVDHIIVDR